MPALRAHLQLAAERLVAELRLVPGDGPVLGGNERALVEALAESVIPAGRFVTGGGPTTVDRVERYLHDAGPVVGSGYRALLALLEGASLVRHRRSFVNLTTEQRLAFLEELRQANYVSRHAARTLIALVKILQLADEDLYNRLGCTWIGNAAPEPRPRWMTERATPAAEMAGETIECDVVVIGTGAGGAVAARELTERGLAVVMLEEGQYHTRDQFNGRAPEMFGLLYHDLPSGLAVGNGAIFLPTGRGVGGSTTINSGTCLRTPERIFKRWREEQGLAQFSSETMAPYFERVEEVLGVAEADARYLGGVARVVARGAEALGYRHGALTRNAPGCDGQGVCCYGCPTDAKRSTNVSYVPLALKAGAMLLTGARADRVIVEAGRAVGVEAAAEVGGEERRVTVRARAVVVACGSLATPVFLLRQGLANHSGQLGRNLSIHPCLAVAAMFDEPLRGWSGIPQGYTVTSFHDEGILFEGGTLPLELAAAAIPFTGRSFTDVVDHFEQLAMFGVMIEDSSRGRVRPGIGGRPLITYMVNETDRAKLQRGVEIMSRIYFAGGARRVIPLVHGFDEWRSPAELERYAMTKVSVRHFDLSAYHPLGTARMGPDPLSSVVGPDLQSHDVPGMYIMDGSVVPSSLGVNPQMTIMALVTRAAFVLADRLS